MDSETIDDLDEAKVLGYFETIRSVFVTKLILLGSHTRKLERGSVIESHSLRSDILSEAQKLFPAETTLFQALKQENVEVWLNAFEDVPTAAILGSWNVFEEVIKHLASPNYARDAERATVDYHRNLFGLSEAEKDDLDFIYYLRNAIVHYNGAYYTEKKLDHTYKGVRFVSDGHAGEKIVASPKIAYEICLDLEKLAMKAWANHEKYGGGST